MSYYPECHNLTGIWNSLPHTAANIIAWLQCSSALVVVMHFLYKLEEKLSVLYTVIQRAARPPKPFVVIQTLTTCDVNTGTDDHNAKKFRTCYNSLQTNESDLQNVHEFQIASGNTLDCRLNKS